jgi:ubiquinone/menaquinone biosynthesis C-methylase UbiE
MTVEETQAGTPAGPAGATAAPASLAAARPRELRTRSRLLRKHAEARPDDLEVAEQLAEVTRRLAALDADHATWFAEIPHHLLMKVNGSPDRKPFLQVGESVTRLLKAELSVLPQARTILDFGVGLSRVMWPMMQEHPDAEFIGFDVDPMMVVHTEKLGTVSEARIVHSTQPIADGTIDATYVISVFTHLMATVDFWLGEIHRVLSDRGQALITYHDETLYADLRAKGHVPRNTPADCRGRLLVGTGAEGSTHLAVFYETAYWEECLQRFFVIEKTAPRGLHGNQSFSVVRKRQVSVDHDRLRHGYLCAVEEELYRLRLAKKLMF